MRSVIPLNNYERNIAENKNNRQYCADVVLPNKIKTDREDTKPVMHALCHAGFLNKRAYVFARSVICHPFREHIPHNPAHIGQSGFPFLYFQKIIKFAALLPLKGAVGKFVFAKKTSRQGFADIMSEYAYYGKIY